MVLHIHLFLLKSKNAKQKALFINESRSVFTERESTSPTECKHWAIYSMSMENEGVMECVSDLISGEGGEQGHVSCLLHILPL